MPPWTRGFQSTFLVRFVVICVFLYVFFGMCFFGYVVVFVLWYVDVCSSKAVLGVAFLHGEARVTICWTQGVTHFKKRAGLRMCLKPIASLLLLAMISGHCVAPRCAHSKSCAQSFVLNRML